MSRDLKRNAGITKESPGLLSEIMQATFQKCLRENPKINIKSNENISDYKWQQEMPSVTDSDKDWLCPGHSWTINPDTLS